LAVIELAARDAYYLDEQDRRIMKALKELPQANSPKVVATLYSYRAPINRELKDALKILGLDKVPPRIRTLQEILDQDDDQQPE
jgi:hypothetical protein